MKEHGIVFSAPMVRATLDGSKTQTRRVIKPQPEEGIIYVNAASGWAQPYVEDASAYGPPIACPYGQPGDRLWVREAWAVDAPLDQVRREREDVLSGIGHGPYYRADRVHEGTGLTWRPSIHMPRWASRITLDIKAVRVERLQDISASDALAEGCSRQPCARCDESGVSEGGVCGDCAGEGWRSEVQVFRALWDQINGKRGYPWSSNPWVWMLSFSRAPTRGQGG